MKKELKLKAKQLRKQGISVKKIASQLGVAVSTVSLWTRGVTLTEDQKQRLLTREITDEQAIAHSNFFRAKRLQVQQKGRGKIKQEEPLYIAGCMLYWGEGSKEINTCRLTNSELPMLVLFKRFLTKYFGICDDDFRVHINAYTDLHSREEIEEFWLKGLSLKRENLNKTTWNHHPKSSKGIVRKLEYGTCALCVFRTEVVQEIFGAIQEYAGFSRLDWLQ